MAKVNLGRVVGKSTYEIWLEKGNTGTEQDFLESLKGQNGKDGVNGVDGKDGYTPIKGVDYFDGKDGVDGAKGEQGPQGDQGIQGVAGKDGTNGSNGQDGFSPVVTVTQTETGATISITDKNGNTTVDILNGKEGKDGKNYNIEIVENVSSSQEIEPNKFYKFGEVTELNISLALPTDTTILNEYMFEFISGNTATTLTLPDEIKWLEIPSIETKKIYQCSIVNNIGILVGVANV